MKSERIEAKAAFIKIFIDKLGDVKNWEHNGIVLDLMRPSGSCICGHAIQYCYEITNGKKIERVGSECINHFKDYSPSLYESLTKTVERLKDEEKKAKELFLNEEVQKIMIPYIEKVKSVREWIGKNYPNGRYINDYSLYTFIHTLRKEPKKDYASIKCLLNWYIKQNKKIEEMNVKYNFYSLQGD